MQDIAKALDIDGIDLPDLLQLISSHFHSSTQSEDDTVFQRDIDTPTLQVRHTHKGQILAIQPLAGWRNDDLPALQTAIAAFKNDPGTIEVARRYVFTNLPMDHALGVKDWFQLLPVPADAPQARQMFARFPATLEVAVSRPTDGLIAMSRRQKALREVELLLNVLYKWGVQSPSQSSTVEWGVPIGQTGSASTPFNVGYHWPMMHTEKREFSDITHYRDFVEIPYDRYYSDNAHVTLDGEIAPAIGSDFPFLVSRYRYLPRHLRDRFLQAAHWFQFADRVDGLSRTASYLALVQTIEALVETPSAQGRCPTCNHLPGAVKHFHALVEQYAGDTPKKWRDAIYKMRSKIVHRGHQLLADADMFEMHPGQLTEEGERRMLRPLVRLILRNWLVEDLSTKVA